LLHVPEPNLFLRFTIHVDSIEKFSNAHGHEHETR
jgi:hypothetical protein